MVAFFTPPPFVLAGGPVELSFVGLSTATSGATISVPSGIQAGDILILLQYSVGLNSFSAVNPSGFDTPVISQSATSPNYIRFILSAKVADGSEGTLTGTFASGTATNHKVCMAARPSLPVSTLTPSAFGYQRTDAAPTSQTIAASGKSPPVLAVGAYRGSSVSSNSGMSPASDAEGGTTVLYLRLQFQNGAPFNTTASMADGGTGNILSSGYFEVS